MKLLMSDETKFKPLSQNPTKSREDSLSTYVRKLKKDGIIDGTTFQKILPSGSSPGVLYGLPKVHKAGCPYRPIVSFVNTYILLVSILQPINFHQPTHAPLKIHLVLQIGPKLTNITTKCALLMLVLFLQMCHLMKQYIFTSTNCIRVLRHRNCPVLFYGICWSSPLRRAISFLMASTTIKLMV